MTQGYRNRRRMAGLAVVAGAGLVAMSTVVAGQVLPAAPVGVKAPAENRLQASASVQAEAPAVNQADVDFMSGMIPHHAQAVIMTGWAATRASREDLKVLCERMLIGQRDEIKTMQLWLSDRGLPVPSATDTRHRMVMNGMEHEMLMPGMLTDEEMKALEAARGAEWDRLFLVGMIKHHQGAVKMVDDLFESYGGAQDETVFRLASDIYADQQIEIERMQLMLSGGGLP